MTYLSIKMAMGPSMDISIGTNVDSQYSSKISGMSSADLTHNTTGVEQNMANIMNHIGPNFGKAIVDNAMNPVENKYNSLALPETYKPATRFPLAETIRSQVDNDPLYSIKGPEMETQNNNKSFENSSVIIDSNNPDNKNDRPYNAYSKPYSTDEENIENNPLKKKEEGNPVYNKIKSMVKALEKNAKSYDPNSGIQNDGIEQEDLNESKGIAGKVAYLAQKVVSYVKNRVYGSNLEGDSYNAKSESEESSGYDSENVLNLQKYIVPIGYFDADVKYHKSGAIDYGSMQSLEEVMKPIGLRINTESSSLDDTVEALLH